MVKLSYCYITGWYKPKTTWRNYNRWILCDHKKWRRYNFRNSNCQKNLLSGCRFDINDWWVDQSFTGIIKAQYVQLAINFSIFFNLPSLCCRMYKIRTPPKSYSIRTIISQRCKLGWPKFEMVTQKNAGVFWLEKCSCTSSQWMKV